MAIPDGGSLYEYSDWAIRVSCVMIGTKFTHCVRITLLLDKLLESYLIWTQLLFLLLQML